MTTINYTYEITRVDPDAKAMDILYTSPDYGTTLVGARMPWDGETVEQIAQMYSPVRNWIEQTLTVSSVSVGAAGDLAVTVGSPDAPDAPLTKEDQEAARRAAYIFEADPIYFMAQRGEATMEEWTAKVAEIKARYPYPAE
jgi:hypothetical protein